MTEKKSEKTTPAPQPLTDEEIARMIVPPRCPFFEVVLGSIMFAVEGNLLKNIKHIPRRRQVAAACIALQYWRMDEPVELKHQIERDNQIAYWTVFGGFNQ